MGEAHAICAQLRGCGWCDLWYGAGEVGWWVVAAGAWGEVVIKVGWVVVIGVSWGVASQGPPLPALKDGLCGGICEGLSVFGGVPAVEYGLGVSICCWVWCGWGWSGCKVCRCGLSEGGLVVGSSNSVRCETVKSRTTLAQTPLPVLRQGMIW